MADQTITPPPGYQLDNPTPPPGYVLDKTGGMPNLRGTPVGGIEGAAPLMGRMGAEALPAIGATVAGMGLGPEAAIPGALLGSAAKGMLKSRFPKLFGEDENKDSPLGAVGNITKDTILQGALPELAGIGGKALALRIAASKFGQSFPAIAEGTQRVLGGQAREMAGSQTDALTDAANNARQANFGRMDVPAEQEGSVGKMLSNLSNQVPKNIETGGQRRLFSTPATDEFQSQEFKELSNKALSDVSHVRNFKLATGEPYTVSQLGLNKAITKGMKPDGTIDADQILKELHGDNSDIYKEAITPESRSSLGQVLDMVQKAKSNPIMDKVLNLSTGSKLMLAAPAIYTGHLIGGTEGAIAGAGVAGGLAITNAMFKKLMSNPETAQLVVRAMRTPAAAPEADIIQKALTAAARGSMAAAATPDK